MRSPMMAASPLASFSWLPRSSTGMKVESLGWLFFLSGDVRTGIQQESEWPYSSHSRVHFPVRATSGRGLESEIQGEGAFKAGHLSTAFSNLYETGVGGAVMYNIMLHIHSLYHIPFFNTLQFIIPKNCFYFISIKDKVLQKLQIL